MSNFSAADILGYAKSRFAPPKPTEKKLSAKWEANIDDHVISLECSPNGEYVAAAGISGGVYIFDAQTGKTVIKKRGHNFGVKMVSWSKNGDYFTSAGQDGKILLCQSKEFSRDEILMPGAAWVECVRWSPHSDTFVSTAGKKIRLWSAEGNLLREYPDQASTVVDVSWSPASEKFVTACYGGLTQWRAENTLPVHKYKWKGSTLVIHWSPNGKYIATGDQDSTVHFWITKNGKDLQMYGYPTKVMELSWDSTSRYLATGGGSVTVWNCEPSPAGTTPMQLNGHQNYLTDLAFQPDGLLLLSGDKDGKISLWDVKDDGKFQSSVYLGGEITRISWAKDNKNFAAADSNGQIKFFSVN